MRKQFLIIVSVAVVSFLLGTLVSMGLTANGIMPNPFANAAETHIVRLVKSDEINVTNYEWGNWRDGVDFVWNPSNPQNNAILSVYCYFEIRWEAWTGGGEPRVTLRTRIDVNGFWGYRSNECYIDTRLGNASDWTLVAFKVNEFSARALPDLIPPWIRPNQESYNITMIMGSWSDGFWTPTYVRNINIIMEVIDG